MKALDEVRRIGAEFDTKKGLAPEDLETFRKIIPKYDKELKALFPKDWKVSINLSKILGYSLVTSVASPWEVTRHNANSLFETMSHLEDGKFEAEKLMGKKSLKYRKIKGKNPEDLLKKLIAWHKKKKDEIIAMDTKVDEGVTKAGSKVLLKDHADLKKNKPKIDKDGELFVVKIYSNVTKGYISVAEYHNVKTARADLKNFQKDHKETLDKIMRLSKDIIKEGFKQGDTVKFSDKDDDFYGKTGTIYKTFKATKKRNAGYTVKVGKEVVSREDDELIAEGWGADQQKKLLAQSDKERKAIEVKYKNNKKLLAKAEEYWNKNWKPQAGLEKAMKALGIKESEDKVPALKKKDSTNKATKDKVSDKEAEDQMLTKSKSFAQTGRNGLGVGFESVDVLDIYKKTTLTKLTEAKKNIVFKKRGSDPSPIQIYVDDKYVGIIEKFGKFWEVTDESEKKSTRLYFGGGSDGTSKLSVAKKGATDWFINNNRTPYK